MSFRRREPDYDDINREREPRPGLQGEWIRLVNRAERNLRAGRLDEDSFRKLLVIVEDAQRNDVEILGKMERARREFNRTNRLIQEMEDGRRSRFLEWLLFDRPLGEGER